MIRKLRSLALGLAVVGMILPQQLVAATPTAKTTDVRIAGGVLAGRVVDASGQPAATTVAIFKGTNEIARVQSDANGVYRLQNLRSGAYTVATPSQVGSVRLWDGAAPSQAVNSLTITEGGVVRGQCDDGCCDAGCDGCGTGCGSKKGLLIGALIVGGAATAIAIAASDDDDSPAAPATP